MATKTPTRHWNRQGARRDIAICLNCVLHECMGDEHPSCALREYRQYKRMKRVARQVELEKHGFQGAGRLVA